MRLLTAGLQVRVLLAEPLDSPHQDQGGASVFLWGSLAVSDPAWCGESSKALSEESEGRRAEGPEGARHPSHWASAEVLRGEANRPERANALP